jgi:hypothetical protein
MSGKHAEEWRYEGKKFEKERMPQYDSFNLRNKFRILFCGSIAGQPAVCMGVSAKKNISHWKNSEMSTEGAHSRLLPPLFEMPQATSCW